MFGKFKPPENKFIDVKLLLEQYGGQCDQIKIAKCL